MRGKYGLDSGNAGGGILSRNAWLIIGFAILFLVYVFVSPINNAVNSLLGSMFSPLLEMFSLAGDSFSYMG